MGVHSIRHQFSCTGIYASPKRYQVHNWPAYFRFRAPSGRPCLRGISQRASAFRYTNALAVYEGRIFPLLATMTWPRDSSSEGNRSARKNGGRSDSADSSSESSNRRSGAINSGGSGSSSSSSIPDSGSTGSSSSSSNSSNSDSGSSEREVGARKAIVGYGSGRSSGTASASRRGGGSSSSSSSSESGGLGEEGGGGTLKNRMKALFKKQEVEVAETEELGDISKR